MATCRLLKLLHLPRYVLDQKYLEDNLYLKMANNFTNIEKGAIVFSTLMVVGVWGMLIHELIEGMWKIGKMVDSGNELWAVYSVV